MPIPSNSRPATTDATVSIVIPTRNRLPFLREAVASVQAQTFGWWELLIVDDASDDETPGWLGSISDGRIRVLRMERPIERSSARNQGLASAGGEYVTFLDDDDRFRPTALEVLVGALSRRGGAVACGARIEFDADGHRRRAPHVRRAQTRALWPEVLGGWVAGPGEVIFRTDALRSIGGWDEAVLPGVEDWELLLRSAYRLGPVFLDPRPVREWRKHPAQWTPEDAEEALTSITEAFLASLPPAERAVGEGAARLRTLFQEAQIALHTHEDPASALRLFREAYRAAPDVARSPMFRARFARGISQALLGRAGGRGAQRLLEASRRSLLRRLRLAPGQRYPRATGPAVNVDDDMPEDG
jgi:hypothetical protein